MDLVDEVNDDVGGVPDPDLEALHLGAVLARIGRNWTGQRSEQRRGLDSQACGSDEGDGG